MVLYYAGVAHYMLASLEYNLYMSLYFTFASFHSREYIKIINAHFSIFVNKGFIMKWMVDENLEWFPTKDAILFVVINTRTDRYYLSVHVQKIKYFSINRSDIFAPEKTVVHGAPCEVRAGISHRRHTEL